MRRRAIVCAGIGFLFGTLGLFALAALSLVLPAVETISAPFMWPGRIAAAMLFGEEGTTAEVLTLTLGSGLLYAAIGSGLSLLGWRGVPQTRTASRPIR